MSDDRHDGLDSLDKAARMLYRAWRKEEPKWSKPGLYEPGGWATFVDIEDEDGTHRYYRIGIDVLTKEQFERG